METRETIPQKTSRGTAFEIKAYLTAAEQHAYETAPQAAMTVKGRISDDGKRVEPEFGDIDLPAMTKAGEYKLIEVGLVSLDGSTENVLKRALDLRASEYKEIIKALIPLVSDPT